MGEELQVFEWRLSREVIPFFGYATGRPVLALDHSGSLGSRVALDAPVLLAADERGLAEHDR